MDQLTRWLRNERGQTTVEFALVFPILVMIIGATIQFGLVLNTKIAITSAAREGARWASVTAFPESNQSAVARAKVYDYLTLVGSRLMAEQASQRTTISYGTSPPKAGEPVICTVQYDMDIILPLPYGLLVPGEGTKLLGGNKLSLQSTAVMRMEDVGEYK